MKWINNDIDNDIYNPILYYKVIFNNTNEYTIKNSKSITITNYNMVQPLCYNIEIRAVNVFGISEPTRTVMCSLAIPFNVTIAYIINNKSGYLIKWNITESFKYNYHIEVYYILFLFLYFFIFYYRLFMKMRLYIVNIKTSNQIN